MSGGLRLPQAPRSYDPANENQLRSKVEEILAYLYRSNSTIEQTLAFATPDGALGFSINQTTGEVTMRVTPITNTLSFGYTVSSTAYDTNRASATIRNFASATTPYDQSLGVLAAGDVRYVTVWYYEAASGAGEYSKTPDAYRFDYRAELGPGSVAVAGFQTGLRPVRIVTSLPGAGDVEGDTVYLTTDDKLYRWNGTAWTTAVATVDLTGQITTTQITDLAISTPKLAALAVTAAKIAAGAIETDHLTANVVTAGKIAAGQISASHLAANRLSSLTDPTNVYIDFSADAAGEYFIKHPKFTLEGDGAATFLGRMDIASNVIRFLDGSNEQGSIEFYTYSGGPSPSFLFKGMAFWAYNTARTVRHVAEWGYYEHSTEGNRWRFYVDGDIVATGSVTGAASGYVLKTGDTMTGPLVISEASQSPLKLSNSGNAADTKRWWHQILSDGTYRLRAVNDAETNGNNAIEIARTGTTIGLMTLGADVALKALSKLYVDGGSDTYIYESSANNVVMVAGGTTSAIFTASRVRSTEFAVDGTAYMTNGPVPDSIKWVAASSVRKMEFRAAVASGLPSDATDRETQLSFSRTSDGSSDITGFSTYKTAAGWNLFIGAYSDVVIGAGASSPFYAAPEAFRVKSTGDVQIVAGKKFFLDSGVNTYLYEASADEIHAVVGGTLKTVTRSAGFDVGAGRLSVEPTYRIYLDGAVDTYIVEAVANQMDFYTGGTRAISIYPNQNVEAWAALIVRATNKFYLDGGGDTYIYEPSANRIDFIAGGVNHLILAGGNLAIQAASILYLDGGSDTGIREESANLIGILVGGTTRVNISTSTFTLTSGTHLNVSGQAWSPIHTASTASGDTTKTIDFNEGNVCKLTLGNSASCALTLNNLQSGGCYTLVLFASGASRTFTWATTIKWMSGQPDGTLATDNSQVCTFLYDGTHVYGFGSSEVLTG